MESQSSEEPILTVPRSAASSAAQMLPDGLIRKPRRHRPGGGAGRNLLKSEPVRARRGRGRRQPFSSTGVVSVKVAAGGRDRKKEAEMRTLAIVPFSLMLAFAAPAVAQTDQQNNDTAPRTDKCRAQTQQGAKQQATALSNRSTRTTARHAAIPSLCRGRACMSSTCARCGSVHTRFRCLDLGTGRVCPPVV